MQPHPLATTPCRAVLDAQVAEDGATTLALALAVAAIFAACDAVHNEAGHPALSPLLSEADAEQMSADMLSYTDQHPDHALEIAVQHSYNAMRAKYFPAKKTLH